MNRKLALITLVALVWSGLAFCGEIQDAARDGDLAKVRMLLKHQPNLVYSEDATNPTPLLMASAHHHTEVAELLLANHAKVNEKDNKGETPLRDAVEWSSDEVIKLLIAHHADVNAKDNDGRTPLHIAVRHTRKGIVKCLLAAGADVNAKDNQGQPP